jgi:two-component system nitrate/nitrite response regulator NarL
MAASVDLSPAISAVVVADPLPLFRDALARVVRTSPVLRVAAETADGPTTMSALHRLRPELAVIGSQPDGLDAMTVLRGIGAGALPTRVVAILDPSERDDVYATLAAGATGCVTRLVEPAEVMEALASAARGETHVARELQSPIAGEIRFRERAGCTVLTERETVILRAVAAGCGAAEIALELHLGVTTVKTHMHNAYEKLGVSDRAAAVAVAIRRGLLD